MTVLDSAMGIAGGGLFFVIAWYIVFDVIGRNYTGFYSGATEDVSGYALAVGSTWAMAFTLRRKAHVTIDVLTARLPMRVQRLLELLAFAVMLLFATLLAHFAWKLAISSWADDVHSVGIVATPLVVPQGLMATGFTVLALEVLLLLIVGVVRLGDDATAGPASGSPRRPPAVGALGQAVHGGEPGVRGPR